MIDVDQIASESEHDSIDRERLRQTVLWIHLWKETVEKKERKKYLKDVMVLW